MYIKPLLRVNRAISASLLFPEHYLQAIATSEIVSVIVPFLNPELYSKILALSIILMYNPSFVWFYIKNNENIERKYYDAELCFSFFFIVTILINNYHLFNNNNIN